MKGTSKSPDNVCDGVKERMSKAAEYWREAEKEYCGILGYDADWDGLEDMIEPCTKKLCDDFPDYLRDYILNRGEVGCLVREDAVAAYLNAQTERSGFSRLAETAHDAATGLLAHKLLVHQYDRLRLGTRERKAYGIAREMLEWSANHADVERNLLRNPATRKELRWRGGYTEETDNLYKMLSEFHNKHFALAA